MLLMHCYRIANGENRQTVEGVNSVVNALTTLTRTDSTSPTHVQYFAMHFQPIFNSLPIQCIYMYYIDNTLSAHFQCVRNFHDAMTMHCKDIANPLPMRWEPIVNANKFQIRPMGRNLRLLCFSLRFLSSYPFINSVADFNEP